MHNQTMLTLPKIFQEFQNWLVIFPREITKQLDRDRKDTIRSNTVVFLHSASALDRRWVERERERAEEKEK